VYHFEEFYMLLVIMSLSLQKEEKEKDQDVVLASNKVFSYSSMDLKSSEKLPLPKPPHAPFWYTFPSSSSTMHPTLSIISINIVGLPF